MLGEIVKLPQKDVELRMEIGDYIGKDGLVYCGKCRGKKQTILPASDFTKGKEMIVRCLCKCQVEERRNQEEEEERRQAMKRIEMLRDSSLIDDNLKRVRLSTFQQNAYNQKAYALIEKYINAFDEMYKNRQGILFWGPVGTGKSYTAACIANELLDRSIPVIMTSFVKILQNIWGNQEEEKLIMNRLNDVSLLIIDDLGTERSTDYALEKVYNIIDSRYRAGKPLILTTNMTVNEMQENTDIRYKRIYDRIFEMCFPVRIAGRSWREMEAEKRFDKMKSLMED
ncbi:MAG: ATP-binding protein [Lachnospiraceae bacterium]|nr:ATP-binding protein [Lachnospiraceae bacterium]